MQKGHGLLFYSGDKICIIQKFECLECLLGQNTKDENSEPVSVKCFLFKVVEANWLEFALTALVYKDQEWYSQHQKEQTIIITY